MEPHWADGPRVERSQDARATRVGRRRWPAPPAGHDRATLEDPGRRRASCPTRSPPCGPETRRTSSPVCSRDPFDEGAQTIVSAPEAELSGALAQLHVRRDLGDLFPGNPHDAAPTD